VLSLWFFWGGGGVVGLGVFNPGSSFGWGEAPEQEIKDAQGTA